MMYIYFIVTLFTVPRLLLNYIPEATEGLKVNCETFAGSRMPPVVFVVLKFSCNSIAQAFVLLCLRSFSFIDIFMLVIL